MTNRFGERRSGPDQLMSLELLNDLRKQFISEQDFSLKDVLELYPSYNVSHVNYLVTQGYLQESGDGKWRLIEKK